MRLRVLLVEDSPVDAVLVERALGRGEDEIALERVDTAPALTAALQREAWDLVLSDYSMPGWSGLDALALVRAHAPDLPFILVSGTIGEDVAVHAMRCGASDYLLKDRLTRLPAAVRRALDEADLRREYERARVALAFLAQASVQLSRSLDADAIAETLVALAVPLLADWAAVDVADETGALRRVATSDPSPETTEATATRRTSAAAALAREAMRGLTPVMQEAGDRPGGADTSFAALPLVMRGTALGCVTLALHGPDRSLRMVDGGLGVELAARAAAALQNARLYEQAQAAIAVRDEFLQIAAHELRTPLTPLSTQVQSLLRTSRAAGAAVPVSRFDAEIEATGRHVQRLTKLVEQLLDVSELGLGAPRLVRESFDLAALVTEVAAGFGPEAAAAGCTVEVRTPDSLVGTWDRGRLGQVLAHLLSNACKFGAGKPITVTLSGCDGRARLAVGDGGFGVAPADRARIFERFTRAVSLRRYGGFGLGLWLVDGVVRAHGGTIAVTSEPGEGATFTVELPVTLPMTAACTAEI